MKLIYLSPLRYPSAKAGSIFSMKSAEAFAEQGIEVELWAPRRRNELKQSDPFTYSGVKKNFTIRRFPTIDLIGIVPGGFHMMSYSFAFSVFVYSLVLKLRTSTYSILMNSSHFCS
jgi:hypothetical protein